jgi:hypothetical protein
VNLNFTDTPLAQALEACGLASINIVVDAGTQNEGIDIKTPVSMKLENVSLKSAEPAAARSPGVRHQDEVLNVTTKKRRPAARRRRRIRWLTSSSRSRITLCRTAPT